MFPFSRTAPPACYATQKPNWDHAYQARLLVDPRADFAWPNNACIRELKLGIFSQTDEHCAFCDGILDVTGRKTIEHFIPKRGPHARSDLAFYWRNLFPACDLCQSNKGTKYNRLLLRPDHYAYNFDEYFAINFSTGALTPNPGATRHCQARARITITTYGLNSSARTAARYREVQLYNLAPPRPLEEWNYRFMLV